MCEPIGNHAERRLICGLCPAKATLNFIQLSDFLMHLDESHKPLKLFACHFCSRAFSSKGNLLCHDCSLFQEFIDNTGLVGYKDCNFAYQSRSLVCSKCGLQIAIHDNLDDVFFGKFITQLHRCFELHDTRYFIHCMVWMLEMSDFQMVSLSFLTNDKLLERCSSDAFLPAYIAAAGQTEDVGKNSVKREQLSDTFNGEEDMPRVKKGLTHSTFFNRIRLENGTSEYECKMCKSRTIPDPRPIALVQHIRDFHYSKIVSQSTDNTSPRPSFNAQIQFRRIELGDGKCQYQCKICGHLTKYNVKANALSQHFNDRHPEMRLVTSETWVGRYLKRYDHLFKETDENSNKSETVVVIDKDASGINDFTQGFAECQTTLRIHFPPSQFLQSDIAQGLELLDVNVFACEQCDTLCAGELSAAAHFEQSHRVHPKTKFSVDDKNHFASLMSSHKGKPALRCFLCETIHCSIMGLKLHLSRVHEVMFNIRSKEEGETLYMHHASASPASDTNSSRALFSVMDVKEEIDCVMDPLPDGKGDDCFNSKLEQILLSANNEIERGELADDDEVASGQDRSEFNVVHEFSNDNGHFAPSTSTVSDDIDDYGGDSLMIQDGDNDHYSDGDSQNHETQELSPTSSRDSAQQMSASADAKKGRKIRRFNAQKQFVMVNSPEGPRYKCKICSHLTKPSVSANTLSQHFSYRHPEMRANAVDSAIFLRRKKTLFNSSSSTQRQAFTAQSLEICTNSQFSAMKRKPNNPLSYNGRSMVNPNKIGRMSAGSSFTSDQSSSEDDIVFGKFLQSISMDEFERLERSQSTVFPYFEIAVKANPRIPYELVGAMSILYVANADKPGRCQRVSAFFGEFLKRCRANGVELLKQIDSQLAAHEFSVGGFLRMTDDLLKNCGL